MQSIFRTTALALFLTLICCGVSVVAFSAECGDDNPCSISGPEGGTYYIALSDDNSKAALKPFVFFHGHNGSGAGVMKNEGMKRALRKSGYVLIAPDGPLFNFRGREARGWAARPEGENPRGMRDDVRFVEQVLDDAAKRMNLDLRKTVVSGFSSGGSMAWFFSCYSRYDLHGVLAVAGGLRRPLPDNGIKQLDGSTAIRCPAGPRRLVHIHGFSDRQVPLEGRGIRAWHQGDVFEGLAVQRHTNQCGSRPDKVNGKGPFWCRTWNKCESGKSMRMCLHGGGHGMPKGWLPQGLKFLDQQ